MSLPPVVALCGSLRASSSNRELLKAYAEVAAGMYSIYHYDVGILPHFNPDLDGENPPATVVAYRELVASSRGMVISTPEYIHALPGALKNALEWLVADSRMMGKPVAILAAQRQTSFALDSLREVLRTMSLTLIPSADVLIPLESNRLTAAHILDLPCVREKIMASARSFAPASDGT